MGGDFKEMQFCLASISHDYLSSMIQDMATYKHLAVAEYEGRNSGEVTFQILPEDGSSLLSRRNQ